jgi:spectinomycin phosphotransferase
MVFGAVAGQDVSVRAQPKDVQLVELASELLAGWGIRIVDLEYAAVGGGSHHWRAVDSDGSPLWITVDDLTYRPSLGSTPPTVRAALETALAATASLPTTQGLDFAVAPLPARDGRPVRALSERYVISLYPYLEGSTFKWGESFDGATANQLAVMLGRLHRVGEPVRSRLRQQHAFLPGRAGLELALTELDQPWEFGPYSERARKSLERDATAIRGLLGEFDDLCEKTRIAMRVVATHGEPHPGNVMRRNGQLLLIDWDTLAADAPERDLWWLEDQPGALELWEHETGWDVDPAGMSLYRLRWKLDDIASFVQMFRSPHQRDADTDLWIAFGDRLTG